MLNNQIEHYLATAAWSLWTELGVSGVKRYHQNCLILLEELLLLTAVIERVDPRLRDEVLDWCSKYYHHFISISRKNGLLKKYEMALVRDGSSFRTLFSMLEVSSSSKQVLKEPEYTFSGKSKLPDLQSPALLALRSRALFGVSARADLITFFLTDPRNEFSVSDTTEIGYSKRNLADILDSFVQAGVVNTYILRNQYRYRFLQREQFTKILGPLPQNKISWECIFEVILPLWKVLQEVEQKSISIKVSAIRNKLVAIEKILKRLALTPPSWQSDFDLYWSFFSQWILQVLQAATLNMIEK